MSVTAADREAVRTAYNHRCGYCGLSEVNIGGELEIDHVQPVTRGGSDAFGNLVYACTTCNRFKGNYWPNPGASDSFRLLHPLEDDLPEHITLAANGRLIGETPRGWFHIRWLHLNRPQLVAWRQLQQQEAAFREAAASAQATKAELRARIRELEREVSSLREIIQRLTE